jgi:hypothetical protein
MLWWELCAVLRMKQIVQHKFEVLYLRYVYVLYYNLAWDMVFKGVEGVVPTQGSLVQLWQGSDLSNDGNVAAQSLTWAPGLVYKSRIVENWVSYPGFFVESVCTLIAHDCKTCAIYAYKNKQKSCTGCTASFRLIVYE